jgi:hypothetical protein
VVVEVESELLAVDLAVVLILEAVLALEQMAIPQIVQPQILVQVAVALVLLEIQQPVVVAVQA